LILEQKFIPIVGQGKARWNSVHVYDLSDLFSRLVEKAVSKDLSEEIWGSKGYMFAENGEHQWSELAALIAKEAEGAGLLKESAKEKDLTKDEALKVAGFEAVSWGLNSRGKAQRAREVLGWKPKEVSVEEEVQTVLREERERIFSKEKS
jgi:nucleoside-diphosphate-sugar epimerase